MTDAHHFVFGPERLSVQCEICGLWPDEPHVVGLGFFCADHCPCAKTIALADVLGDNGDTTGEGVTSAPSDLSSTSSARRTDETA